MCVCANEAVKEYKSIRPVCGSSRVKAFLPDQQLPFLLIPWAKHR